MTQLDQSPTARSRMLDEHPDAGILRVIAILNFVAAGVGFVGLLFCSFYIIVGVVLSNAPVATGVVPTPVPPTSAQSVVADTNQQGAAGLGDAGPGDASPATDPAVNPDAATLPQATATAPAPPGPFVIQGPVTPITPPSSAVIGTMFIVGGSIAAAVVLLYIVLCILCGTFIASRKRRTFCIAVSGIHCLNFPIGTALGVISIVTLMKPVVRDLFLGLWQPNVPPPGSTPPMANASTPPMAFVDRGATAGRREQDGTP